MSQNLGSRDFWRIANSVLNKFKSAIPPQFNSFEVLSYASDKAEFFAENFMKSMSTQAIAFNIPKMFDRIKHASLLHKLSSYGISGQVLGHLSLIDGFKWLWMGSFRKSSLLICCSSKFHS